MVCGRHCRTLLPDPTQVHLNSASEIGPDMYVGQITDAELHV